MRTESYLVNSVGDRRKRGRFGTKSGHRFCGLDWLVVLIIRNVDSVLGKARPFGLNMNEQNERINEEVKTYRRTLRFPHGTFVDACSDGL